MPRLSKVRILIIRNDNIGDMVVSTGVFRSLKKSLPNCEITLVCSKATRPLVEKNPYVDELLELGIAKRNYKTLYDFFRTSFLIRKRRFDIGIDLRGSIMNSSILLFGSGIPTRVARTDMHPGVKWFVNKPVSIPGEQHIVDDIRRIVSAAIGFRLDPVFPEIVADQEDEDQLSAFFSKNGLVKVICLCPVARLKFKQWPLEHFRELVSWIESSYPDFRVLLLGTKQDSGVMDQIRGKESVLLLDFNLRLMSLLFKKSGLVLAQDGGPMHIAWASKARLLALLPNAVENELQGVFLRKFSPLNDSVKLYSAGNGSNLEIPIDQVKSAVEKILAVK